MITVIDTLLKSLGRSPKNMDIFFPVTEFKPSMFNDLLNFLADRFYES